MIGVKGAKRFNFICAFQNSIHEDIREAVNTEEDNLGPFWGPGTNLQGLPKQARAQTASHA